MLLTLACTLQARHPDAIRVGVVWQVDAQADAGIVRVAGSARHPQWLKQVCTGNHCLGN